MSFMPSCLRFALRLVLGGAVLAIALPGPGGLAAIPPSCASQPRQNWLSSSEIEAQLHERGYEMVRLSMGKDRCVDVVARDRNGRFVDLRVNPHTAEIVTSGRP